MANGFNIKIKITDKSPEVIAALQTAIERALESIGQTAEGYAKDGAPVDTGRLRNSIAHQVGMSGGYRKAVIGSNVEYAEAQEMAGPRSHHPHYLRNAVANHVEEYKNIFLDSLKNA